MKRGREHDAHAGLTEGVRKGKYRPPAPKNPIYADKVLKLLVAFVALVIVLTPLAKEAMAWN